MSNVPEGAHVSEDGKHWWDGETWHPVDGTEDEAGDYSAVGEIASAAFDFSTAPLRISGQNSDEARAGEPLKIAFEVGNTGTAAGNARVALWIDNVETQLYYVSPVLQVGENVEGSIGDIPGQTEGRHWFEVMATPSGPYGGWTSNEIDIPPGES